MAFCSECGKRKTRNGLNNTKGGLNDKVIARGITATATVNDVQRTSYTLGNVRVWTEGDGKTIITILRIGSQ